MTTCKDSSSWKMCLKWCIILIVPSYTPRYTHPNRFPITIHTRTRLKNNTREKRSFERSPLSRKGHFHEHEFDPLLLRLCPRVSGPCLHLVCAYGTGQPRRWTRLQLTTGCGCGFSTVYSARWRKSPNPIRVRLGAKGDLF